MEYQKQIKELITGLTTKYPNTMSCVLTCPQCKSKTLQCVYFGNTHVWECMVKDCHSKLIKEIPSIKEMEMLFKLSNQLKDLKRYGLI